jgi:hypothetical protein
MDDSVLSDEINESGGGGAGINKKLQNLGGVGVGGGG